MFIQFFKDYNVCILYMATTLKKYIVKTGGEKRANSRSRSKNRSRSKSRSKIKNTKEFEKLFRVFVVNKRPPNKNDILTDEEIDRYFELLGDDKNNTFTEQGHIFVCFLLKQLHNDNSIDEVFDAMAGFKPFTIKQKKSKVVEQKVPRKKAIRAAMINASDYVSCVLVRRDGCIAEFEAQDQRRRSNTMDLLNFD